MNSNKSQAPHPTVRLHKSSPLAPNDQKQMLVQSPFNGGGWPEGIPGAQYLNAAYPKHLKHARYHKRASSGSSVTSTGPPSPLDYTTLQPHIATQDHYSPHYENFEYPYTPQSANTSKSLPTPTTDGYMYPNQYSGIDMRRIHSTGADESASYALSAAPSVSSVGHNSPATPHTNIDIEFDDSKYYGENDKVEGWMQEYLQFEPGYPQHTPAYHQSIQDVFPDQYGAPQNAMAFQQQLRPVQQRPSMMANRLQAAQQDHLQAHSPVTSNPREKSPFQQTSRFNEDLHQQVQMQQSVPTLQKTRTSISPKELQLNQNDVEDAPPLFAPQQQSMFANRRTVSNLPHFYDPGFSSEPSMQMPQELPYMTQRSRQESSQSNMPEPTPEFPAHLTSMESTVEEGFSEPSSQQSRYALQRPPQQQQQQIERPSDTTSHEGTYSCTYHGCLLRFDTPAKLQKHKREGHRQHSPASPSAAILAARNSQAGPHECKRINPSTGKPCNSVFSRPYDLTRHEDTIHNNRKMKVRCHLCTEEKSFSRNDALTRHMRVVHPDIAWEGKQKRRTPK